ncbi:hypothetical protein BXZ70DRAFT_889878 [Cristinia sonorae]|uniref:Cupredoxin n=1 Tax=Cristinia sonorae TaxID=1940300 RepID=A0A8K0XSE7_9AGAR|nr:hypothetical protein BXZ70DRAFT_889878 [Cristinia sonorae]
MRHGVVLFSLFAMVMFTVSVVSQTVHNVTVGGGKGQNGTDQIIAFDPPFLMAQPLDIVVFIFKQQNHTVSESTLERPCEVKDGGFDTGFIPVPNSDFLGPFPAFQFIVQNNDPVWLFCRQANHCANGMVFALNPPDEMTWEQFTTNAAKYQSISLTPTPTPSAPPIGVQSSIPGVQLSIITYSSYPGSAAPTSFFREDHLVAVGESDELSFAPSHLIAQPGDTITFHFTRGNHSVVQSSFETPCESLTQTSTSMELGFDSGFIPFVGTGTNPVNFTITINDTNPIFAFCSQTIPMDHCRTGMVFAANTLESGSTNFFAFQQRALQLPTPTTSGALPSASDTSDAGHSYWKGIGGDLPFKFMTLSVLVFSVVTVTC